MIPWFLLGTTIFQNYFNTNAGYGFNDNSWISILGEVAWYRWIAGTNFIWNCLLHETKGIVWGCRYRTGRYVENILLRKSNEGSQSNHLGLKKIH